MSTNDPVGKLFRTEDSTVVEWKIANFSTLSDESYDSPDFSFSDACCNLRIHPNGDSQYSSEGYVALYLFVQMAGECAYSVDFTLCLKDVTGKEQYRRNLSHTFEKGTGFGNCKICHRSDVMNRGSELLLADILTVMCTLKSLNRCPVRVSLFQRLQTVSSNMKAIMKEETHSDVVLKLEGRDFHMHRVILETGSKVFSAMLTHDMAENRTGEISINDVDADVFQEVLLFMYSGQVNKLCARNVFKLYKAADKYDLSDLKELCKSFMEGNISVKLFCDIVALADTYNEKELMKFAKDFFNEASIRILESAEWEKFLIEHSGIAAQLLTSVMKENAVKERKVSAVQKIPTD